MKEVEEFSGLADHEDDFELVWFGSWSWWGWFLIFLFLWHVFGWQRKTLVEPFWWWLDIGIGDWARNGFFYCSAHFTSSWVGYGAVKDRVLMSMVGCTTAAWSILPIDQRQMLSISLGTWAWLSKISFLKYLGVPDTILRLTIRIASHWCQWVDLINLAHPAPAYFRIGKIYFFRIRILTAKRIGLFQFKIK